VTYSWKQFSSAKTDLLNRLGDSAGVFWTSNECGIYLIEALRTFNSIANFYRDRTIFNTQSGYAFYDLTQNNNPSSLVAGVGTATSSMLGYSITDRYVINSLQYSLLEPVTDFNSSSTWTGTEQFTMDDLTRAIERRRNQFLALVMSHITRSQVVYPTGSNGRVLLSDSIIDIHRVAWLDADGSYTPLYKEDEYNASTLISGYENSPDTPTSYSTILQSPKGIQIIPPSNDIGTVDLLTINNPSNLDETIGVLLNIPDDLAWIIKYGALADLLGKEGQSYDPIRSKYCESRYEQGLQIALSSQCINQVAINGQYIQPTDLNDLDYYNYNWQNSSGQPTDMAIINRNLIVLTPIPDSVEYSIQLDILRNIPIPSNANDYLQIGREHYDLILDYSVHLAMFKCQGVEFEGTYPMLDRFMQGAMMNNDKLSAQAKQYSIMKDLSGKQEIDVPRIEKSVTT
jgi:hypothetical protein